MVIAGGENGDPRYNDTKCSCADSQHTNYTLKKKPTEQWEKSSDYEGKSGWMIDGKIYTTQSQARVKFTGDLTLKREFFN